MERASVGFKVVLSVALCAGFAFASHAGAATTGAPARTTKTSGHHGVSSHIVLHSHKLVSGSSESGTLVIGNNTGRPIRWSCAYLEVQLTNSHWPLEIHPTPCARDKTLHVGTTRLHFTLWARQVVCQPSCKPLPPGTYYTKMLTGPAVAHPGARTVHVVA